MFRKIEDKNIEVTNNYQKSLTLKEIVFNVAFSGE